MKTLVLAAQKGGTGKTTLALNLAVAAHLEGVRTVVLDLDPQGSAATWSTRRESGARGLLGPLLRAVPAERLAAATAALAEAGGELAVVDTAPHAGGAAMEALRLADLVLIPVRPGLLDLAAVAVTAELCDRSAAERCCVLNQCPPQGRLADEAAAAIARLGVPLAAPRCCQRVAYTRSVAAGRGVLEHAPSSKAAAEIRPLYEWVKRRIAL